MRMCKECGELLALHSTDALRRCAQQHDFETIEAMRLLAEQVERQILEARLTVKEPKP